ncbi:MAG: hypothetical protein EAY75_04495 [Bacteroidetes bacterium]|nr:MAG: hypothetical protein EAY75_04495 [Bacteroidota bacterium]
MTEQLLSQHGTYSTKSTKNLRVGYTYMVCKPLAPAPASQYCRIKPPLHLNFSTCLIQGR